MQFTIGQALLCRFQVGHWHHNGLFEALRQRERAGIRKYPCGTICRVFDEWQDWQTLTSGIKESDVSRPSFRS